MISRTLSRRLERLEERMILVGEPTVIVVYIDPEAVRECAVVVAKRGSRKHAIADLKCKLAALRPRIDPAIHMSMLSAELGLAAFNGGFRAGPAILIAVGAIAVAAGSVWLRWKAGGFRFSQLKQGDAAQRLSTRRILVGLRWTTLLETLLVGSAFGICNGIGRQDLVWPAVGAAVSLHFAPMGYLFRLPLYYVTAALGCVVSLIALTQAAPASLWVVGVGMGGILWATAAFAILKSELLANHAAAK